MPFIEKTGKYLLSIILKICAKYSYKELSKSYSFFKILNEFGIEYPKDEFESLYLHTTLLFALNKKPNELIELILLDECKKAFKKEYNHGNEGAFQRQLNSCLHTSKIVKELKQWNAVPEMEIEEFHSIYKILIKDVATPVESELINGQRDILNSLEKGLNKSSQNDSNIEEKLNILLEKSNETSQLQKEYERQVNSIAKILESGLVKQALSLLFTLKNDIWHDANDKIRFKILTNIGVCYYKQINIHEASKFLIEAYQYNPNSKIAMSNIVNAYIGVENFESAQSYLQLFLKEYPEDPKAYGILIRLQSEKFSLEKILEIIPGELKNNEEVLLSLGLAARKHGDYDKSVQYFEKALKSNPDNSFIKEHILSSILEKYNLSYEVLNLKFLDATAERELKKALKIIEKLLRMYENSEIDIMRIQLLLNKSFVLKLLNQHEDAIISIDNALLLEPNNPKLLKQKGLLLAFDGKNNDARIILEKIQDYSNTPDVPCLLADIYSKEGNLEKGIKILENYLVDNTVQEFQEQVKGFLLELYIEGNYKEKAEKISNEEFQAESISNFINKSKAKGFLESSENAIHILVNAKKLISNNTAVRDKYLLAEAFVYFKSFKHAVEIFELFVNTTLSNSLTTKLAQLYYSIGEKGKCLNILKNLRRKYGILRNFTPLEISIYQEYGDYENAKKVAEEFLSAFPNNLLMKIRLAEINLRLDDFGSVDSFLIEDIDIWQLTFEDFKSYLAQLMARNFREKLFTLIYEYRRKRNDSKAHILYVQVMLQYPLSEEECRAPKRIWENSVVTLSNINNESFSWIVENRPKEELLENEINLQDERFLLLQDKEIGNDIRLKSSSTLWKIKSLTNKRVFAFHESQSKCETIFSGESPFYVFHSQDLPQFLDKIRNENKPHKENYDLAKRLYKDRKAPIGTIASSFKKNPILIWQDYKNSPDIGIQCAYGSNDEWLTAINHLSKQQSICSDITGLLTAFELNLGELIVENFGEVLISTSTYNLIFDLMEEQELFSVKNEAREPSKLELFLSFVKSITKRKSSRAAMEMNSIEKLEFDKLLETSFVDTLLLAKETDSLILSDDLTYRELAKSEHSINGIWTQVLLKSLFNSKKINLDEYQEKIVKLATFNYFHTAIDEYSLLFAAKEANYRYDSPFYSCLNLLKGKMSSEDSSLPVAFGFLFRLWSNESIAYKKRTELTLAVITTLCTDRIIIEILKKIDYLIRIQSIKDRSDINEKVCQQIWLHTKIWKKKFNIIDPLF